MRNGYKDRKSNTFCKSIIVKDLLLFDIEQCSTEIEVN